jgi:hypothetical protein
VIVAVAVALALGGPPLPPDVKPWPIGVGPGFRLAAAPPTVLAGKPVGRFHCTHEGGRRFGAHLELFVRRRVLLIPPGVGVARHRRCSYPLRTRERTGVVEISRGTRASVGDLFRLWGQPLGPHRIAGFRSRAPLLAFVGGKRWHGDARAIPLTRHAQIVLELGGYIPPHPRYLFADGL